MKSYRLKLDTANGPQSCQDGPVVLIRASSVHATVTLKANLWLPCSLGAVRLPAFGR